VIPPKKVQQIEGVIDDTWVVDDVVVVNEVVVDMAVGTIDNHVRFGTYHR